MRPHMVATLHIVAGPVVGNESFLCGFHSATCTRLKEIFMLCRQVVAYQLIALLYCEEEHQPFVARGLMLINVTVNGRAVLTHMLTQPLQWGIRASHIEHFRRVSILVHVEMIPLVIDLLCQWHAQRIDIVYWSLEYFPECTSKHSSSFLLEYIMLPVK